MEMAREYPQHPCRNCIYFKACGENTRTMPCKGRVTKSQKKKEVKHDIRTWKQRRSNGNEGTV